MPGEHFSRDAKQIAVFLGAEADVIVGIYSNLLTFLGGGRACIGFKFSQLEMSMWYFLTCAVVD